MPNLALNIDGYEDRLEILKILSAAYPLPRGFLDPMDGDRIQTRWQLTSGRAENKWWNKVNYTLTVWRIQALQMRGEFQHVTLNGTRQVPLPDAIRQELCGYYDAVRSVSDMTAAAEQHLQRLFWAVHDHTVTTATRAAVDVVPTLPAGERDFALGWGKVMVKVLDDVNFSTDRHFVGPLNAEILPQRICNSDDVDPLRPSNLSPAQRATVIMIAQLFRASDLSPIYTPVLEIGAGTLDDAIGVDVNLERDLGTLRRHLRTSV
jgi:hypothetical protein